MPTIDKEAVKTLAIAVGPNEAARQLGIKEATVRQWSARGKWFAPAPPKPNSALVTSVTSPSHALQSIISENSNRSKVAASKAARVALEHLAEQQPEKILKSGQNMRHVTAVAALAGSWEAQQQHGPVNLQVLAQQATFNLGGTPAQE